MTNSTKFIFPILARFFERQRTAVLRKQTIRELSALDSRGLKDIGIDRSDIYALTRDVTSLGSELVRGDRFVVGPRG